MVGCHYRDLANHLHVCRHRQGRGRAPRSRPRGPLLPLVDSGRRGGRVVPRARLRCAGDYHLGRLHHQTGPLLAQAQGRRAGIGARDLVDRRLGHDGFHSHPWALRDGGRRADEVDAPAARARRRLLQPLPLDARLMHRRWCRRPDRGGHDARSLRGLSPRHRIRAGGAQVLQGDESLAHRDSES